MEHAILYGSGGLAKEMISYLEDRGVRTLYCVSTEPFNNPAYAKLYEVKSAVSPRDLVRNTSIYMAVASGKLRRQFLKATHESMLPSFDTFIHPTATVSRFAKIGRGSVLGPQAIVTGDAQIGEFVFMNSNATVGHDTSIGDFCTLHPNSEVCGDCLIEEDCELGIASMILPGRHLERSTRVSAGSIVRHDFLGFGPDLVLQGNPAQPRGKK